MYARSDMSMGMDRGRDGNGEERKDVDERAGHREKERKQESHIPPSQAYCTSSNVSAPF